MENEVTSDIWFTSDTHFGHANIIDYCSRPFYNVNEMNATLTNNWNMLVKPNDLVYHLGDFSFNSDRYLGFLNGHIVLVRGNHDKKRYDEMFHNVVNSMPLKIAEFNCYLTHRPLVPDSFEKKGIPLDLSPLDQYDFIIAGHVHEKWKTNGKNVNVGVDMWDMKPIHISELIRFLRSVKTI